MGINIGAVGAALDGAQQGFEHAQDRQFMQGQRDFQAQQQTRAQDQWKREDEQRTAIQGIDPNSPQDVQLRAAAAAARQSGDIKAALEYHDKADKIAIDRAEKNVQQILASSQGKSASQLATEAAQVLNSDPVPGGIDNIRDDGNGGVVMTVTDKITGQSTEKAFANADQTREWLMAYKAPNVYAALQKMKQAAAIKAQEKANEPQRVSPGQALVQNGKVIYQAPPPAGFEYIGEDANGNPQYRKMAPSGTAAGGATGAGGKPTKGATGNVAVDAQTALDTVLQHTGEKPDAAVYAAAKENVGRISAQNPKVPAEMVARVALDLAKDPNKAMPAINPETGKIDLVYDDGVNGKIKVNEGVGDAVNLASVQSVIAKRMAAANGGKEPDPAAVQTETRRAMQTMTKSMMSQFDPKRREQYTLAAFDQVERRKMNDALRAQAEQVITQTSADKTPEQAQAIRKAVEQSLQQRMQAVDNVVNLVFNYGEKPKQGGGAPAPKPAARTNFDVRGIRAAVAANPLRPQVEPDASDRQRVQERRAGDEQAQAQRTAANADLQRQLAAEALTPEKIRTLRPSQAKAYIDKYGAVLSSELDRALRRQL